MTEEEKSLASAGNFQAERLSWRKEDNSHKYGNLV